MEGLRWFEYLAVFAGSVALALVLTPLALRVAVRLQVLDHPGEIKTQATAVPYLGGVAILVAFVLAILAGVLVRPPVSQRGDLAIILGLGLLLATIGLLDDLVKLDPWLRLGVEVGCGIVVSVTSVGAELFGNAALDGVTTVVWIVVITNAVNFLDNMDGLTGSVTAVASFATFVLAAQNGQFLVAVLAIALAGCALGFLPLNVKPALIHMGDAGAMFIGFLLAVLTMKIDVVDAPPVLSWFVPVLLLVVPLFDTALVMTNRVRHGRNPMRGGLDHSSHRLVRVGIPVPITVSLICACGASGGVFAFVLTRVGQTTGLVLVAWLGGVALVVGLLLSTVPVYETSRGRDLRLQHVPGAGELGEAGPAPSVIGTRARSLLDGVRRSLL